MHFILSDVNHMCSQFREIDLFLVKTKHGIAAVQKLEFLHDHLRKEQCAGRELSVEIQMLSERNV